MHYRFRTHFKCFWQYWLLAIVILLAQTLPTQFHDLLEFHNSKGIGGDPWTYLTSNLVHINWPHALMNIVGIWLVAYIAGAKGFSQNAIVYSLGLGVVVVFGVDLLSSEGIRYQGFSGVIHGLLIPAAVQSPHYDRWVKIGFFIGLFAKTVWEQSSWYSDESIVGLIGGSVSTEAHLFGVIGGALLSLILIFVVRDPCYRKNW